MIAFVIVVVAVLALSLTGRLQLDPVVISKALNWVLLAMAAAYFLYLLSFAGLDTSERKRVIAIIALFAACAMFWAGFEQTGASLNLFAERYVDRMVDAFSFEIPTAWFQSLNSVFILIFAAPFSMLWVSARRIPRMSKPPCW